MPPRLVCAFVDDVENADAESIRFIGAARDRILLDAPGSLTGLCIWVCVEADADAPLSRLALSLRAHGQEIDWITYEDAAVAPPPGRPDAAYTIDHIFALPAWLTCRECVFEVHAASEAGPIGAASLSLERPLPF
ncbi:hypothetical protein IP92_00501 [Pseudoduganella flava]|uniref:Uncharacterized protein n=1 Tax=Pseudoduganella flava TaxID=871742 RepID=A0A562Q465_9BURK|nr:hypothetical protein [Pseudoduganella flava]QGZ41540.1 hypothetical protein GO485_22445 [Pseudoduganella flava]TWI51514.1 hypothetical protein IP92_00501 [Pseudoduganella flava]